jgi:hypothetical protein
VAAAGVELEREGRNAEERGFARRCALWGRAIKNLIKIPNRPCDSSLPLPLNGALPASSQEREEALDFDHSHTKGGQRKKDARDMTHVSRVTTVSRSCAEARDYFCKEEEMQTRRTQVRGGSQPHSGF